MCWRTSARIRQDWLLHPELAEQDAPLRVVLVVADARGDEADVRAVVGGNDWSLARESRPRRGCQSAVAAGRIVDLRAPPPGSSARRSSGRRIRRGSSLSRAKSACTRRSSSSGRMKPSADGKSSAQPPKPIWARVLRVGDPREVLIGAARRVSRRARYPSDLEQRDDVLCERRARRPVGIQTVTRAPCVPELLTSRRALLECRERPRVGRDSPAGSPGSFAAGCDTWSRRRPRPLSRRRHDPMRCLTARRARRSENGGTRVLRK